MTVLVVRGDLLVSVELVVPRQVPQEVVLPIRDLAVAVPVLQTIPVRVVQG
jgi:hypothetical protein